MAKKSTTRRKKTPAKRAKAATSKKRSSKKSPAKKKVSKKTTKKATSKKAASKKTGVPKVGARVQWKSLPGMVFGKVIAILKKDSTLNGKAVKASPEAPRIKLRSDKGKVCVHKPESVKPA